MKIIEINTFYNENLIADIHIKESSKWVDEMHIVETDHSFQYKKKSSFYDLPTREKVNHHFLKVKDQFKSSKKIIPNIDFRRQLDGKLLFFNSTWFNEMMQRKLAIAEVEIGDDDILILGDIDEIIDSRNAQFLIDEVKKRKIITIKLYLTLFYFNLFSPKWQGPSDYSYRLFLIQGKKFKDDYKSNYDKLRKMGERSQLIKEVFCPNTPMGFHHSWLGDSDFISKKLKAYSHIENSHLDDKQYIQNCIENGISLFQGNKLELNNDIKLLSVIEENREQYKNHFFIAKKI